MTRVFFHYVHKLIAIVGSFLVALFFGLKKERGIYSGSLGNAKFNNRVVFAFWDSDLVHLGDQLFHQPVIELLAQRNDWEVVVSSRLLADYFRGLGVKVIQPANLGKDGMKGALFVSKKDMLFDIWNKFGGNNFFIGIDYGNISSDERISVFILNFVSDFLKKYTKAEISFNPNAYRPKPPLDFMRALKLPNEVDQLYTEGKKYFIYNNYAASDLFSAKKREVFLEEIARKKKREGFRFIHIGSQQDKEADKRIYDFIDFDLRGKVGVEELFKLISLPIIAGVIGFDAYPVHVGFILGKDLYVAMKNDKKRKIFAKRFVPMYPDNENLIKEIV